MSALIEYAKSELNKAFPDTTDEMQEMAKNNVIELITVFSEQGHSGMSAPYVLRLFERLARFNPLLPLTGEDDEWGEPYGNKNTQQNKRCSKIFRDNFDNSTAHNIEGKVMIDEDGFSYTNNESSIPVTFPYVVPDKPKYVHVKDQEKHEPSEKEGKLSLIIMWLIDLKDRLTDCDDKQMLDDVVDFLNESLMEESKNDV